MNSTFLLFIDDERFPPDDGKNWVIARSSAQAQLLCENGAPSFISFDHDLGDKDTSMIFVHWMIEQDLDCPGFIPHDFHYYVHSQNNIGTQNLIGLIDSYLVHRQKNIPEFKISETKTPRATTSIPEMKF